MFKSRVLKLNRWKVALALGVAVTLSAAGSTSQTERRTADEHRELKVGYDYDPESLQLDPAKITSPVQREIIDNLYGRLVRMDESGQLVADLPSGFTGYGNRVSFSFDAKARSARGEVIGPKDAAASLKRLLLKSRHGHEDLGKFLCDGKRLASIDDPCVGIQVYGNQLVLETPKQSQLHLLIAALDSADYSVIALSNLDAGAALKASSAENTTGAYYAVKKAQLVLFANTHHARYSTLMPQKISLEALEPAAAVQAYRAKKINLLPPTTYWSTEADRAILDDKTTGVYETIASKVLYALYSDRALKDFSPEQRLYFGLRIASAYQKLYPQIGGKMTAEFFQPLGVGGLDLRQLDLLAKLRDQARVGLVARPLKFGVPQEQYVALARELRDLPEIKLVAFDTHPCNLERQFWPDVMMMATDSAESESLSLSQYDFGLSLISPLGAKAESGPSRFAPPLDKAERIASLRRLHLATLQSAQLVPIEAAPFFAAAQSGWKFHQTKVHASMTYWTMRQD